MMHSEGTEDVLLGMTIFEPFGNILRTFSAIWVIDAQPKPGGLETKNLGSKFFF